MPAEFKEVTLFIKYPPAIITEHSENRAKAVQKDPYSGSETMLLVKVGKRWWISGYTWEREALKDMSEETFDRLQIYNDNAVQELQLLSSRLLAGEFKTPREYYDELSRLTGESALHDQ